MKNTNSYNSTIINVLFFIFPISIILGNLFINLNIFLLLIFAIFFYNEKIIKFKINFFDKIILIFFIFTFIVLIINFLESYSNNEIFPKIIINKTFWYFRYFILYLVLRVLIGQKILRLDWFSLSCAICATFVCFDIFVQYFFGKDIFGIAQVGSRHYSAVFGKELIAGGYLQKFSLFVFFLPFVLKKNLSYKILIQIIVFIIFFIGIILSGNRMPLLLFIASIFIYILFDKKLKKYFFIFFIAVSLLLALAWNTSQTFRYNSGNFYFNGKDLIQNLFTKNLRDKRVKAGHGNAYVVEFYCFKKIVKINPLLGGGIKSYRTFSGGCNNHPHNYYFEILTDLGLIGLSIILYFVFMLFREIFFKGSASTKFNLYAIDGKNMPFFLIFLFEFFPLRTSGSFFTTGSAATIFIILAVLVSWVSKKKNYNY